MKLVFKGWKREVTPHSHPVAPVKNANSKYFPGNTGQPLTWDGPFRALGKVNKLALSGAFLVEFTFEEQELRNWLQEYVKANPEAAIRLLAHAQAEAVIALNVQPPVASE